MSRFLQSDEYTLRHLATHLHISGDQERLEYLLTHSPDWMVASAQRLHGYNTYLADLDLARHSFSDPLSNDDLFRLIQIMAARQVAGKRTASQSTTFLMTLALLGREDEALNHVRLISDPSAHAIGLYSVYMALAKVGRQRPGLIDQLWIIIQQHSVQSLPLPFLCELIKYSHTINDPRAYILLDRIKAAFENDTDPKEQFYTRRNIDSLVYLLGIIEKVDYHHLYSWIESFIKDIDQKHGFLSSFTGFLTRRGMHSQVSAIVASIRCGTKEYLPLALLGIAIAEVNVNRTRALQFLEESEALILQLPSYKQKDVLELYARVLFAVGRRQQAIDAALRVPSREWTVHEQGREFAQAIEYPQGQNIFAHCDVLFLCSFVETMVETMVSAGDTEVDPLLDAINATIDQWENLPNLNTSHNISLIISDKQTEFMNKPSGYTALKLQFARTLAVIGREQAFAEILNETSDDAVRAQIMWQGIQVAPTEERSYAMLNDIERSSLDMDQKAEIFSHYAYILATHGDARAEQVFMLATEANDLSFNGHQRDSALHMLADTLAKQGYGSQASQLVTMISEPFRRSLAWTDVGASQIQSNPGRAHICFVKAESDIWLIEDDIAKNTVDEVFATEDGLDQIKSIQMSGESRPDSVALRGMALAHLSQAFVHANDFSRAQTIAHLICIHIDESHKISMNINAPSSDSKKNYHAPEMSQRTAYTCLIKSLLDQRRYEEAEHAARTVVLTPLRVELLCAVAEAVAPTTQALATALLVEIEDLILAFPRQEYPRLFEHREKESTNCYVIMLARAGEVRKSASMADYSLRRFGPDPDMLVTIIPLIAELDLLIAAQQFQHLLNVQPDPVAMLRLALSLGDNQRIDGMELLEQHAVHMVLAMEPGIQKVFTLKAMLSCLPSPNSQIATRLLDEMSDTVNSGKLDDMDYHQGLKIWISQLIRQQRYDEALAAVPSLSDRSLSDRRQTQAIRVAIAEEMSSAGRHVAALQLMDDMDLDQLLEWLTKLMNDGRIVPDTGLSIVRQLLRIGAWIRPSYTQFRHVLESAGTHFVLSANASDARAYSRRGDREVEANAYTRALASYTRAIDLAPLDPETYMRRGDVKHELGLDKQALADYTQSIALNPDSFSAYLRRGVAYKQLGANELALDDYNRAISIEPQFPFTYLLRAELFLDTADYEVSAVDLLKYLTALGTHKRNDITLKVLNKLTEVLFGLGMQKIVENDYEGANALYVTILELDLYNYPTRVWLGNITLMNAAYDVAFNHFSYALETNPESVECYLARANCSIGLQNWEDALLDCQKALSLEPENGYVYSLSGDIFVQLGHDAMALECYDRAIVLLPENLSTYVDAGKCAMRLGDFIKAVEYLNIAIDRDSTNAKAFYERGVAFRHLAQLDQSIQDFLKVTTLMPDDGEAYLCIAMLYVEQDQLSKATFYATLAAKRNAYDAQLSSFLMQRIKGIIHKRFKK